MTTHPANAQLQAVAALPITSGLGHAQQRVERPPGAAIALRAVPAQRRTGKTALGDELQQLADDVIAQRRARAAIDKAETLLLDAPTFACGGVIVPAPARCIAIRYDPVSDTVQEQMPSGQWLHAVDPAGPHKGLLHYDAITDSTFEQQADGDWVQIPNDLAERLERARDHSAYDHKAHAISLAKPGELVSMWQQPGTPVERHDDFLHLTEKPVAPKVARRKAKKP